jgi:NAD(P)-dependent dehydrogenase (short-subunit alcohol dehydrogenase family)
VTVAVVTGATRGVGKGIALALGEVGATVPVTRRSTLASTTPATPRSRGCSSACGRLRERRWRTFSQPFWEQPLTRRSAVIDAGLRAQHTTACFAAPRLIA